MLRLGKLKEFIRQKLRLHLNIVTNLVYRYSTFIKLPQYQKRNLEVKQLLQVA